MRRHDNATEDTGDAAAAAAGGARTLAVLCARDDGAALPTGAELADAAGCDWETRPPAPARSDSALRARWRVGRLAPWSAKEEAAHGFALGTQGRAQAQAAQSRQFL